MRMEQAQPGIRNGPGVAVKFSTVDCNLQAFFKAFSAFLQYGSVSPVASTKPPKVLPMLGLLRAVRELTSSGGMLGALGNRAVHMWKHVKLRLPLGMPEQCRRA